MSTASRPPMQQNKDRNFVGERHLDQYTEELNAEIAELRGRVGDIGLLKRQFDEMSARYAQAHAQKSKSDNECSQKLFDGVQVIDSLANELD